MNIIDFGLLIIVALCALKGYKSGVFKSLVSLAAFVISAIVAYSFKGYLADFLSDILPFYNFGGSYEGLTSISILFYHGLSFLVLFIISYSILNIVIIFAGFLDKIVKATIILYLPNKILGALVGFLEGMVISFVIIFTLAQLPFTQEYVIESSYGYTILNRMPVIRTVLADSTVISSEIAEIIVSADTSDSTQMQIDILQVLISNQLVDAETINDYIEEGKLDLTGVTFQ